MTSRATDTLVLRPTDVALRRHYLSEGLWTDDTLGTMLLDGLLASPANGFHVWSMQRGQQTTFGAVADQALRLAEGLRQRGIGPGDTVCIYVPNSVEGALGFVSVPLVGAVVVPVAPFYGFKELEFILRRSGARVLITAESPAGGRLEGIAALRSGLPQLEDVYVIGAGQPAGMRPFDELVADTLRAPPARVDPDDVAAIAFTSGTTSDPKGVILTHRALCSEVRSHMVAMPRPARATLMGGPISHIAGMLGGLFLPAHQRQPVHLIDGWDPALVLRAMREHDLSAGSGAPVFLNSLLAHPDTRPEDIARIAKVSVGGATVPDAFMDRAHAAGLLVARCYGSTEQPTITLSRASDPVAKRLYTDGRALPGVELRIVDEGGHPLEQGQPGEVWSRGPDMCAGYVDAEATADTFTADGWYRSGDVGVLDEQGFLTITDRLKDIIVRNGVKIGAVEVENVLLRMPQLLEVAVVAAPHERTGEQAHAFVRLRPGATAPTLAQLRAHLDQAGLARQKWPEALEVTDEFPRTASGKIRKASLRQDLRARAPQ